MTDYSWEWDEYAPWYDYSYYIKTAAIESGVTSIGNEAFYNCDGLESITVATGNSVYRSENNCVIEKTTNTMICGCKNSIIPSRGPRCE